ncbi:MAG: penicillin-binding protein 2 [Thiohalorhabdus sp.]|uniref:penicillin-binding protein 2 n=1 Tax=Thiohalorhabdus sp. TaxID=3094134 RepID=UPI002FC370DE
MARRRRKQSLGKTDPASGSLSSRRNQVSHYESRLRMVGLGLAVLSVILAGRLFYLQIEQFLHYRTLSDQNRIAVRPIAPPRGLIYDRRGKLLVENEPSFTLQLYPDKVESTDRLLDRLVALLPAAKGKRSAMQRRIRETPPYLPATLIQGLNTQQVALFAARQHQFPSIRIRARSRRHYRQGPITSHVLGYLAQPDKSDFRRFDPDLYPPGSRIGKMGLEREYEQALHGTPGQREVETDAFGRVVREISKDQPEPGRNLVLTLDEHLQEITHEALAPYPEASAVALNPQTGGVLAMASRPTFDPNDFIGRLTSQTWSDLLDDPDEPLVNRAIQGLYPPASTVKPALALAGLAEDEVDPKTELTCNGSYRVGKDRHTFHCWRDEGHGSLALDQAVVESCDVFFYKLAERLGIETIHDAYQQFGLGRPTGIDLPGERGGLNPGPDWKRRTHDDIWYPGETVMTAIGQGYMEATPLQLGVMAAALANGGFRVKPHLVRAFQDPVSGDLHYRKHERNEVSISQTENLDLVQDAMRRVVSSIHGTAHGASAGAIPMAGKTGTAQVVRIDRDREEQLDPKEKERRLRDHALFVAFAPVAKPRIAVAVVVEHGISGGRAGGQAARQIIDGYFHGRN